MQLFDLKMALSQVPRAIFQVTIKSLNRHYDLCSSSGSFATLATILRVLVLPCR
jgi:hypothetical protein